MKFLNSSLSLLLLLTCLIIASEAQAEASAGLSATELSIQEKAAQRLYLGGPDEDDLAVREDVTSAKQKITRRQIEREVYKRLFKEDLQSQDDEDSSSEEDE